MSSALDQEFETGVRLIRDAYMKKLSQRESEIVQLKGDNARKDAELKELSMKVQQLEVQLARQDKKMAEMTRLMSKLNHFKQSVMNSFQEDDYSDISNVKKPISTLVSNDGSPSKHSSIADLYSSSAYNIRPHTAHGPTGVSGNSGNVFLSNRSSTSSLSHHNNHSNNLNTAAVVNGNSGGEEYNSILRESVNQGRLNNNNDMSIIETMTGGDDDEQSVVMGSGRNLNNIGQMDYSDEIRRVKQQIRTNNTYQPPQQQQMPRPDSTTTSQRAVPKVPVVDNIAPQQPTTTTATGTTSTVDGREYFRKAKSILSYDEFNELIWNVKAYNNRQQSRSKTLENVFSSIGGKHRDIFSEFEKLISS